MLKHRSSFWRCFRQLNPRTTDPSSLCCRAGALRQSSPSSWLWLSTGRRVGHDVRASPRELSEVDELVRDGKDPWTRSAVAANQKRRERSALRQQPARRDEDTSLSWNLGRRDPSLSDSEWDRRKRELQHLRDPLELAGFVRQELRKGKAKEMLQLVRMASHSLQCTVGWNHIIDHLLANGSVGEALKVYNEMKKRAQFPDSYTYSVLLRGLSANAQTSGVLSKALSVYHSLFAPNSRVQPSIIHTNAALRVCARALDMDALWGVAAKIPESGPAAPNAVTYVTIINAIRQTLILEGLQDETADELMARRERGIMDGRRMWEDIVRKWRNADLVMDEKLVCAMARLLLIGSRPRDWDDVLSLVEQTMDIPRLIPRLGTLARQESSLPLLRTPNVTQEYRFDDDHLSPAKKSMRGDEFLALDPEGIASIVPNPLPYATPGNNTLSVIQEACLKIVASKASQDYWDLLTDPVTYNITPDLNNVHNHLRNLRQSRDSVATLDVLQTLVADEKIRPVIGTFRIAMSTCVRDKNNHNSLSNANQILHMMSRTMEDADSKVVALYAELAIRFPLATGKDLMNTLVVLHPLVSNIRLQLNLGGQRRGGNGVGAVFLNPEARQDAIFALSKIYGVYDRVLNSDLIAEEQKSALKVERARLAAFVQRARFKDQRRREAMREKYGGGGGKEEVSADQADLPEHGEDGKLSAMASGPFQGDLLEDAVGVSKNA